MAKLKKKNDERKLVKLFITLDRIDFRNTHGDGKKKKKCAQ